ncbi:hypothetical protein WISP_00410 [Willisornis vidua]|uniref:Transmembrane protein 98 n=1 Tax=Willisornis vidua TaxID=1566151 RepID=A0ABQ9E0U5_9PASS|nr:hypothetical protein WISP_00410 [Willisornis vidua]
MEVTREVTEVTRKVMEVTMEVPREVTKEVPPEVPPDVTSPCPRRAAALLLSVSHLVLVTRSACRQPSARHWVERSLAAAEEHMAVLRQAAMATESERPPAPPEHGRQEQSAI